MENTRGYLASISSRLYDLMGWDWGRATLLMNTVYVIAKEPVALQLRYLQTLADIGNEKNTTIVFPVPIDIIQSWLKKNS